MIAEFAPDTYASMERRMPRVMITNHPSPAYLPRVQIAAIPGACADRGSWKTLKDASLQGEGWNPRFLGSIELTEIGRRSVSTATRP